MVSLVQVAKLTNISQNPQPLVTTNRRPYRPGFVMPRFFMLPGQSIYIAVTHTLTANLKVHYSCEIEHSIARRFLLEGFMRYSKRAYY